jgi:hypothetical protein
MSNAVSGDNLISERWFSWTVFPGPHQTPAGGGFACLALSESDDEQA